MTTYYNGICEEHVERHRNMEGFGECPYCKITDLYKQNNQLVIWYADLLRKNHSKGAARRQKEKK